MKQHNQTQRRFNRKLLSCALASCMLMAAPQVFAQSTGATIRGQVSADLLPRPMPRSLRTMSHRLTRTSRPMPRGIFTNGWRQAPIATLSAAAEFATSPCRSVRRDL